MNGASDDMPSLPARRSSRGRSVGLEVLAGLLMLAIALFLPVTEAAWLLLPALTGLLLVGRAVATGVRRSRGKRRPAHLRRERVAGWVCAVWWLLLAGVTFDAVPLMLGGARDGLLAGTVTLDVLLALAAVLRPGRIAPVVRADAATLGILLLGLTSLQVHVWGPAGTAVAIPSPVRGTWYALQAGRSPLLNHHWLLPDQHDALDILIVRNGSSHPAGHTALTDYYAYRKPIFAPLAGTVTDLVDGLPDQQPGHGDRKHLSGNRLILTVTPGVWLVLDHLEAGSLRVHLGDAVTPGEEIAQVGNSGNTSEPHLHLQLLDRPHQDGTGHTRELLLTNVTLLRGGHLSRPHLADLRRNDQFTST